MTLKRTQQRRGTSTQWTTLNPTLAPGEIGFETNTGHFKIGTGIAQWNDLEYFKDSSNIPDISLALLGIVGNVPSSMDTLEKISASIDNNPDFSVSVTSAIASAVDEAVVSANGYTDTAVAALDLSAAVAVSNAYTDTKVANLIDAAPTTLNTLNEIAAALNDDANYAATVTTAIASKQDRVSGVSDTEIGYLDGLSSGIQSQLNGKASSTHSHVTADITGLQTSLDAKAATVHTHAIADVTGLQTALDSVVRSSSTITTNYTLQASDAGKVLKIDSATPVTITVPAVLSTNQSVDLYQKGAGVVTITGSGVTIQGVGASGVNLKISNQYTAANIFADTSSIYAILGNVEIA